MQFTLIAKQDKIERAALSAMLLAIADTIDRNPNLIKERSTRDGEMHFNWEIGEEPEPAAPTPRFVPEGPHHMWDHWEGCYWIRESDAHVWAKKPGE